ncbi:MAG TPA: methyltransferase domain-containing protein [Blastocatellia bacterium]|nr:methyltransferase domain-containing protein [Blastocatellia bacterium]
MRTRLFTTPVRSTADVRDFFDRAAPAYAEQHGHPDRLLKYRVGLIKRHARPRNHEVVLDVGCGNGHHLQALAADIGQGIGVDLSPAMIEIARVRQRESTGQARLSFFSDDAQTLGLLAAESIDLAICVGAFEHMLDKPAVLANVRRVLKPRGRFFCLTINGGHVWYQRLAPRLGLATCHLSTDRFLNRDELLRLLFESGFSGVETGCWTFIPRGDMPAVWGTVCRALDLLGRLFRVPAWRGGLWVCGWKAE